jgi:inorganic phosphate transporter, PiT family
MLTLLIIIIAIALLFDVINGFHETDISVATIVSTRVLSPADALVSALSFWVIKFISGTFWFSFFTDEVHSD